jgi:hypothetical protein
MPDDGSFRNESRNCPRFVPRESLSICFAAGKVPLLRGDVEDLSEVGARVLTGAALTRGNAVTVDVHSGYSLLFRAEARIVWRNEVELRRDSRVCAHGIFFTDLSPFSRRLIRRLGGLVPRDAVFQGSSGAEEDEDLKALFPELGAKLDPFDLLSDPVLESPLYDEAAGGSDPGPAEISGNLGYFTNADVLQMLEAARASGVLYIEGEYRGQIHLRNGRICGCFSSGIDERDSVFRLILADRGRFRFTPSGVRENLLTSRTTTELLLEAHFRRDNER